MTSLPACLRPVVVFPQAWGPSITTAGEARSAACTRPSTTRGTYQSPIRPPSVLPVAPMWQKTDDQCIKSRPPDASDVVTLPVTLAAILNAVG